MILLVQMVPAEALMISVVKTLDGWNLRNSIVGLTITYVAFVLPFTVWTLRGFVAGVPRELEEAAMVDGSSRLRAFFTVTLPLVAPGLVATGIFAFIQAWNEFTFALVIMDRPEKETLPGVAAGVQLRRPRHRLGRRDGGLDAHHRAGDRLLPARPPPGGRRA